MLLLSYSSEHRPSLAEMVRHVKITRDAGISIYFYIPHNPWQRGARESINGLIRKVSTEGNIPICAVHSQAVLSGVALELKKNKPAPLYQYENVTLITISRRFQTGSYPTIFLLPSSAKNVR